MPDKQHWERRQGMRLGDGWRWHHWQPCTEAEAQRVTGLHSWQARQVCKCAACDGSGWVPAGVAPVEAPSGGPNPLEVSEAIHAAAAAIYFNDSSDYERALWTVLRKLSPAMADLMETDTGAAFLRVKSDAFEHATSGVGGNGYHTNCHEPLMNDDPT